MKCRTHVKQVRGTSAGKSISAYVVLDKHGKECATIHVYHTQNSKGPLKRVDVFQPRSSTERFAQYYGRDLNSALHEAVICDITLYAETHTSDATQQILKRYLRSNNKREMTRIVQQAERGGMVWSNPNFETGRWQSLYYLPGFERLEYFGYKVIHVF